MKQKSKGTFQAVLTGSNWFTQSIHRIDQTERFFVKTKMIVLVSATAAVLTLPLYADALGGDQRDQDAMKQNDSQGLGDLKRSDRIIGREVANVNGQKIGHVKDLALDLQNGRIAEVIVATGGTLGMNEHIVAVPPSVFTCDSGGHFLRFNSDAGKLQTAPDFELSHWQNATDRSRVKEAYQRFGADPYFADYRVETSASQHGAEGMRIPKPQLGFIARATSLAGSDTMNMQNEKLATVHSFIVDVPAGRIVEVILSYGGFLGMDRDYSAVPPQAFHWNADESLLTLDTTRSALRSMPHFTGGQWGNASDPARVSTVYSLYHVEPYFWSIGLDRNAENVRSRTDAAASSAVSPSDDQKNNVADMDVSAKIHKSIVANNNLSKEAKDVKVVTADGRVTLIGTVDTEDEKRLITEAASKVAGQDKVDANQIKVSGVNPTPASITEPTPAPLPQ
jgi:hyperosmotically inducible protein